MQQMFGTLEERGSLGLIEFSSSTGKYLMRLQQFLLMHVINYLMKRKMVLEKKMVHEKKNIVLLTFCVIFYGFGRLAR